jgi:hypothetical protein
MEGCDPGTRREPTTIIAQPEQFEASAGTMDPRQRQSSPNAVRRQAAYRCVAANLAAAVTFIAPTPQWLRRYLSLNAAPCLDAARGVALERLHSRFTDCTAPMHVAAIS